MGLDFVVILPLVHHSLHVPPGIGCYFLVFRLGPRCQRVCFLPHPQISASPAYLCHSQSCASRSGKLLLLVIRYGADDGWRQKFLVLLVSSQTEGCAPGAHGQAVSEFLTPPAWQRNMAISHRF